MELEWNDLSVILAVCRAGSLSGAARLVGQNHSTVFRRINSIEERTGVRFFERLPHGYKMTDAGEAAMACAERIESEVHTLSLEVLGQDMRLQGNVRVTAPEGMVATLLPRAASLFLQRHPQVCIELIGTAAALDLSRRQAEIAIRATRKPPDTSLGRKICDFRFAVYGAPGYVEKHRGEPLDELDWCLLQGIVSWLVPLVWKKLEHGERQTVLTTVSAVPLLSAVADGLGVTAMPCYMGDADQRLVRVHEPFPSLTLELWILTHPDLRHTVRVKTLMSFLYDYLCERSDLFEGKLARSINQKKRPRAAPAP